jgi:hypothetical protein
MKTMFKFRKILFLLLTSVLFFSCSKDPGIGGTSSISGKVFLRDFNASFTTLYGEYYAHEQRVYLVYGDDEMYSQDTRTHYDGTYRFERLKKGKYTVYAYSKDSTQTSPSGYIPVKKIVEITKNNQHIILDNIIIID